MPGHKEAEEEEAAATALAAVPRDTGSKRGGERVGGDEGDEVGEPGLSASKVGGYPSRPLLAFCIFKLQARF